MHKVVDLIFGRWRSQILYTGVKLGVFDALASGPNFVTTSQPHIPASSPPQQRPTWWQAWCWGASLRYTNDGLTPE
jgi:hypothetical protein